MSDVIGKPSYPKVRVLKDHRRNRIEEKINELHAKGFRLRGKVQYEYTGSAHGSSGEVFVATMVKEDS